MENPRSSSRLQALAAAQRELSSPGASFDQRLALACERARELTGALGAAIAWRKRRELEYRAADGVARELYGLRIDAESALAGRCLVEARPLSGTTIAGESAEAAILHRAGVRARIAVPVPSAGALEAALEVHGGDASSFDDDDAVVLELLAGSLALSLERCERERLESSVLSLSRNDQLTGLLNRSAGDEAIRRELERAIRYARPLSFVLLEVDQLRLVNDLAGHLNGDTVLREIGRLIARRLRRIDLGVRFGGAEFLVALPETELSGAQDLAEALRSLVEHTNFDLPVPITISGGVATRRHGEHAEQTIARATELLTRAKGGGRNRVLI